MLHCPRVSAGAQSACQRLSTSHCDCTFGSLHPGANGLLPWRPPAFKTLLIDALDSAVSAGLTTRHVCLSVESLWRPCLQHVSTVRLNSMLASAAHAYWQRDRSLCYLTTECPLDECVSTRAPQDTTKSRSRELAVRKLLQQHTCKMCMILSALIEEGAYILDCAVHLLFSVLHAPEDQAQFLQSLPSAQLLAPGVAADLRLVMHP